MLKKPYRLGYLRGPVSCRGKERGAPRGGGTNEKRRERTAPVGLHNAALSTKTLGGSWKKTENGRDPGKGDE